MRLRTSDVRNDSARSLCGRGPHMLEFREKKQQEVRMSDVPSLLETKRLELGETKKDFAKRFNWSHAMYSQVVRGVRGVPERALSKAANILGVEMIELRKIPTVHIPKKNRFVSMEDLITAEELEYLTKIAQAAGAALPLSLLLQHLEIYRKRDERGP